MEGDFLLRFCHAGDCFGLPAKKEESGKGEGERGRAWLFFIVILNLFQDPRRNMC